MADTSALPEKYWGQPSASLLVARHTAPDGLTTAEAHQRLEGYGPNRIHAKERITPVDGPFWPSCYPAERCGIMHARTDTISKGESRA